MSQSVATYYINILNSKQNYTDSDWLSNGDIIFSVDSEERRNRRKLEGKGARQERMGENS